MRTIEWSTAFKKDFKRIKANPHHAQDIDQRLGAVVALLCEDTPLPDNCRDHALVGNWKDYRECHIKPDLLLIYNTEEPDILRLARLGSHSELFRR
jgi:mRNA interferase YafQ